jgi:glycosyltransferase involved in cell wall biosynthesis
MAAGKVIIAWDHVGFTQVISPASAFLVEQGSVKGLAQAVRAIATDPAGAQARVRAAQEIARGHSFTRHMHQFDEVIGSMRTREPRR